MGGVHASKGGVHLSVPIIYSLELPRSGLGSLDKDASRAWPSGRSRCISTTATTTTTAPRPSLLGAIFYF